LATAKNYTAIAELVAGEKSAMAASRSAMVISRPLDLEAIDPAELCEDDVFLVEANQTIFADGMVLEGIALVDESAVSGQSAAALRSADGLAAVMRDSRVVEGKLLVQVAPRRGHPLDWMGGAPAAVRRSKTAVGAPR
jgi:potassium-transporting ATPase ATP-binding subunit